jgi:O-methyltransferase
MDNLQLLDVIAGTLYSSRETQMSSYNLGKYVVENNIEGDIIECGVAMGGNFASMILGVTSIPTGEQRKFWGFDSFQGIQLAGKKDTQQAGIGEITHNTDVSYEDLLVSSGITVHSRELVENNLSSWGLNNYNIELVDGWVQHSIPVVNDRIEKISILRLDMDVYHPTKYCLDMWWDKITEGGIIIIDDWALGGVRTACDEFFEEKGINPEIHNIENSTPTYFFKKTI